MKRFLFSLPVLMFMATEGNGGDPSASKPSLDLLDPSKLNELSDEQIASLKDLSNDDIKQLAEKYPNKATQNNYLVLEDTRKGAKQLHNLSSWQNLAELRGPLNQQFWRVLSIKGKFFPAKPAAQAPTQDLTEKEILGADGLKSATSQTLTPISGGQNDQTTSQAGPGETGTQDNVNKPLVEGSGEGSTDTENLNLSEEELNQLAQQKASGTTQKVDDNNGTGGTTNTPTGTVNTTTTKTTTSKKS